MRLKSILQLVLISVVSFATTVALHAQQTVTIDLAKKYQVVEGFGASGAWNTELVGKHWSNTEKEKIAKYLFSKELDNQGNPLGIGLSRWRFNIGAGSVEQGSASGIPKEERRVECFMTSFNPTTGQATYDWNKQSGQQWFLNAANDYGVDKLLAFCNSAPYFMNKNGKTNMSSDDRYASTNLKDEHYDDFAEFMATVIDKFNDDGILFDEISPINEPQWGWEGDGSEGQEGCPFKNEEAAQLFRELDTALTDKGLPTQIFIGEAARWDCLDKVTVSNIDPDKTDQIRDYFDPTRTSTYVGNLSHLKPGIAGHSYWINNKDDFAIRTKRQDLNTVAESYGVELYQSEYNLLGGGDHYDDYWLNALYLCKIIQADLVYANAKLWDFWTAIERERWDQKNRFFLLPLKNTSQGSGVHNYTDLDAAGGYVGTDKNLWAYGNFSRFIRPSYTRVEVSNANDLSSLFGSAYLSEDSKELVVVYVNWSQNATTIINNISNLSPGLQVESITPYVTDGGANNLSAKSSFVSGDYTIGGQSIVTFVVKLQQQLTMDCNGDLGGTAFIDDCQNCVGGSSGTVPCTVTSLQENNDELFFSINTNVQEGKIILNYQIDSPTQLDVKIYDLSGREVQSVFSGSRNKGAYTDSYDISQLSSGTYFCRFTTDNKVVSKKIIR